ncbi:MAG TPA: glycosyltransferase family 4 protein [Vicinamibacterales bacterium]|nr:glycosyltransferase family 4 protein [Vicinamibacterales bacterium]
MARGAFEGARVLLVGPYPPPFGGIASHFVNLIPGLLSRGAAEVAVVSFGEADAVHQEQGATIYRVNTRRRASQLLTGVKAGEIFATVRELGTWGLGFNVLAREAARVMAVHEVAQRHRSDVVSFYQTNESLALLPLRRMWGRSRGIVLTVFGEIYDDPDFFAPRAEKIGRQLGAADARLASSLHCARSFQKIGVNHPIEAVYYGVELERFDTPELREPFRAAQAIGPDEVLVLYMGRFNEEMGVDRVLDVIPELLAQHPNVRFALAGAKGPLSDRAASVAATHAGRVTVLPNVPFKDQPALYAASDLVLAPTADQHACMGMSIKEAMAAGKPAVASNAGGIPEAVVEGETGFLVPLDATAHVDHRLFADAISKLATDASLRARMGAASRTRAHEIFSNERTVDRITEVFRSVRPA